MARIFRWEKPGIVTIQFLESEEEKLVEEGEIVISL